MDISASIVDVLRLSVMANRPLRTCNHPMCNKLGNSQYCDDHLIQHKQSINKRYSVNRAEYHRLYNTSRWQYLRRRQLDAEPFCKCGSLATVVDHIKDHKGDVNLFYDPSNLQSMCKRCHDRKTASTTGFGRGGAG